ISLKSLLAFYYVLILLLLYQFGLNGNTIVSVVKDVIIKLKKGREMPEKNRADFDFVISWDLLSKSQPMTFWPRPSTTIPSISNPSTLFASAASSLATILISARSFF